jgi:hypothetical protein
MHLLVGTYLEELSLYSFACLPYSRCINEEDIRSIELTRDVASKVCCVALFSQATQTPREV